MNIIYIEQLLYRYLKYFTVLYVQWLWLDIFTNALCKSLKSPWALTALQNVTYSQAVENTVALLNKLNRSTFNGEIAWYNTTRTLGDVLETYHELSSAPCFVHCTVTYNFKRDEFMLIISHKLVHLMKLYFI